MKIAVSVAPAILEIQDDDFSTRTATEVQELVRERIAVWLASDAQADWQVVTEDTVAEQAA
jgi:hypothetical protein